MNDIAPLDLDGEFMDMADFTERSYLDYSMYVILDRALPHIGDGLKPVQRRIIYAMSELHLSATSKHKKSARTIGDVLGKYHPHGDSACYEAMVLMAQPFSYRHPLVDGEGNWGSPDDPKSFAAMRYTEARLDRYSEVLLNELGQGTTDWQANFDGCLEEPRVMPARLPNILLNGTMGIAVGMATDVPPHNAREVAEAAIHLIENKKADVDDLMQFIKAPDYPTQAEIISPPEDIRQAYATGRGSIKMRATYERENGNVIINALPHHVSGAKIIEQIAAQMQAKKLPMIEDIRDESDHETPTRIVIITRSNRVNGDEVMSHLFATTDLEKSYRINMNMIGLDGKPQVKNLVTLLNEWITFRRDTVRRRLEYRLGKINRRLHLLEGLLTAFLNIDEVIEIIRTEDNPKTILMERFALSDTQTEYILDTKLRQLARLEEMKIRDEQGKLDSEKGYIEQTLGSSRRMNTLIKKEIHEAAEKYGDERMSELVLREEAKAISQDQLVPSDPITVILSEKGWVRSGKGHELDPESLNYKSGDSYLSAARGRSNQNAVLMDDTGRTYGIAAHTLPSARSLGEPVTKWVNPPPGATFIDIIMPSDEQEFYLMASSMGYGFITKALELQTRQKSGKALLNVPDGYDAMVPMRIADPEKNYIFAVTSQDNVLCFPVSELPHLSKGKGNKIINIPAKTLKAGEEWLAAITTIDITKPISLFAGETGTILKPAEIQQYIGKRASRGKKIRKRIKNIDWVEQS